MKAIAVMPGKPNSIHLREVPNPRLEDVPNVRPGGGAKPVGFKWLGHLALSQMIGYRRTPWE